MTVRKPTWRRDWAVLPGEVIREQLDELGWTQARLAAELRLAQPYVSDIILGRRAVSVRVALALETVLGPSAEFWLSLQTAHDLTVARRSSLPEATGPEAGQ